MRYFQAMVVATLALLLSCQSAPQPVDVVAAPAAVTTDAAAGEPPAPATTQAPSPTRLDRLSLSREGFSPLAMEPNNTITVALDWAEPASVMEWVIEFAQNDQEPVRVLRGTQPLPSVDWDGKTNAGVVAPQGEYQARLFTALADGILVERVRSEGFWVDVVPPSGTIAAEPTPYVLGPADILVNPPNPLTIQLHLESGGARWATWRLAVVAPDGRRFQDFVNEDFPNNRIVWDGRSDNNAQMTAGTTYRLEAEIFDIYGNRGVAAATLVVQAAPTTSAAVTPVAVVLDGTTLAELPLYFAPYSSDLALVSGSLREANDRTLARLVELLRSASFGELVLVGHANQVLYADPAKAAYEQRVTLLPLSLARATAVKQALVRAGLPAEVMRAVGVGAADPVAAFSDALNRWKNRRVVVELK